MNVYTKQEVIALITALPECTTIHAEFKLLPEIKSAGLWTAALTGVIQPLPDESPTGKYEGEIRLGFYGCHPV